MIYIDNEGRRRQGKAYTCQLCEKKFIRRLNPIGSAPKYCSPECSLKSRYRRKKVVCSYCGKCFEKRTKKITKHGLHFCSRKCKDTAQRLEEGCSEIWPPHYGRGQGKYTYRRKAMVNQKCADCGESRLFMLVVHHIDGNRNNNQPENLEVVCYNHHAARHLKFTAKGWVFNFAALTPREKLGELDCPAGI